MKKLNSEKKKQATLPKLLNGRRVSPWPICFFAGKMPLLAPTLFFQVHRLLEIGQIKNM